MLGFNTYAGPVEETKTFVDGQSCGYSIEATLPEIVYQTAEFEATGTTNFPIYARVQNMEATFKKKGDDKGLKLLVKPTHKPKLVEYRWVQAVVQQDGTTENVLCRAVMKCIPNGAPSRNVKVGEIYDNEIKMTVLSYKVYVDNERTNYVDKLGHTVEVSGINVWDDIKMKLG